MLVMRVDLVKYIAADIVGHINSGSHPMRTVGGGYRQQ